MLSFPEELSIFNDELMTVDETAAYLGVDAPTVTILLERNALAHIHLREIPFLFAANVELYRIHQAEKRGDCRMIIYPQINKFQGINPILQTLCQTINVKPPHRHFHAQHIADISNLLNDQLIPYGYTANIEDDLKVTKNQKYFPDVSIIPFDKPKSLPAVQGVSSPTRVIAIPPTESFANIVITRWDAETEISIPVTVIELLSPTNLEGDDLDHYLKKRTQILQRGIHLVELHYLHLSPPISAEIRRYPEKDTTAFHILITKAHALDKQGRYLTELYRFGVHQPIPTIAIPLLDQQSIAFNLDDAYQFTFSHTAFGRFVNYDELPMDLLTRAFRTDDLAIIEQRVAEIRAEYDANNPKP